MTDAAAIERGRTVNCPLKKGMACPPAARYGRKRDPGTALNHAPASH
jgi:hypothetical protein